MRAPIPTRVERLCEYYGSGRRRTKRAARSMWEAPPPKPVPAVPMQGMSGWGVADDYEADAYGSYYGEDYVEEEQFNEIEASSGWGDAEPSSNVVTDAGDEKRSNDGSQEEAHDDVVQEEDDLRGVEGYSMAISEDGERKEDEEGDAVNDYNEHEEAEEYTTNASDYEGDEMEEYGLEMDEDDGYHDLLMDEDDGPLRPSQRPGSLAQLYCLPYDIMFHDTFHHAKLQAATLDRFLLVNLQSQNFLSSTQNSDLWTNDVVKQSVRNYFLFQLFQKLDNDDAGGEGTKVCAFYKIRDDQLPALLVLDPVTGQMLSRKSGAVDPDEFMLFVEKYTSSRPSEASRPKTAPKTAAVAEAASETAAGASGEQAPPEGSAAPGESSEKAEQEPVPMVEEEAPADAEIVDSGDDEPEEGEKMYKMRVRFPDGSVVPKKFGCKRRVSKLFAFCRSALRDAGKTEQKVAFRIIRLAERAFEEVQNNGSTFEGLGLNLATVSVVLVS